ncbi:MAG: HAD family hydrolase, partial [Chloroflexota bacterium]
YSTPMIQAITFDFWDTLVKDESDEPKRAAMGLPSKPAARLQLLVEEITRHHPAITPAQVSDAFQQANRLFNHYWKVEHHTPPVAQRLQVVYDYLNLTRTPGFTAVVRQFEEMEVDIPPDYVPGAAETLATLAGHYKLGLISDTIHTPGRGIRRLLAEAGLLDCFQCFIFSDEVGASKPNPIVFEKAAAGLGVPLSQIVHVGDRESNDVAGPLAVGMKAILFTGAVDRGRDGTQATAVCRDFTALPAIIGVLNS